MTSLHVRRAREGEQASLSWVVARFTPFLRIQAEYRLQGALRRLFDPDDLVDEVWMIVLPRIASLRARDGHWTPVLLKYLGTTLLNRVNDHLSRYLRTEAPRPGGRASRPTTGNSFLDGLPDQATSVVTTAARDEACEMLYGALESLEPEERELFVLRGIEQHLNQDVAHRLGLEPSTVTRRYQRILATLRARLPGSIFDEMSPS